jgi:sugar phosphate isomerase/epimerase
VNHPLSLAISGFASGRSAREAIEGAARVMTGGAQRFVQLDATMPTLRPRELDRSGRRDLAALLKRSGVLASGLDLFIPAEHFGQSATVERAIGAVRSALELIADLAALGAIEASGRVLSLTLPEKPVESAVSALGEAAADRAIQIADFASPPRSRAVPAIAPGVDAAASLAAGADPGVLIAKLAPASVRLSDWSGESRVEVGSGRLDVPAFAAAVGVAGVRAPVVIDTRGLSDPAAGARAAISAFGGLFGGAVGGAFGGPPLRGGP